LKTRQQIGCECYRERQNRWVEPTVLYLLWRRSMHGYEIMAELPGFGFLNAPADTGAIYRTLRHLEKVGLVTSEWDTTGSGPAKRRYTITEQGKKHLHLWAESLHKRRKALDDFLKRIDALFEEAIN